MGTAPLALSTFFDVLDLVPFAASSFFADLAFNAFAAACFRLRALANFFRQRGHTYCVICTNVRPGDKNSCHD